MTKLIIAEKAMLGRDIARAVTGKTVSETTPLPISGNGYTVVAASGHLLELKAPEKIKPEWEWTRDFKLGDLPISVSDWPLVPSRGASKKLDTIKQHLKEASLVINAGDPDDEGQWIVDSILNHFNYTGQVQRVLVNDNIEANIRKAFEKLENNEKYVGMGQAAYARSMADAAFGFSWTRLACAKLRSNVSVGRVQTPTLGLVVRRDESIANHEVRHFFELIALTDVDNRNRLPFTFRPSKNLLEEGEKRIFDKSILEDIAKAVDGKQVAITSKVTEEKKAPPLPYSLTTLQAEMNKKHGFATDKTLKITQDLRDKYKAITYNRTDSQYLKEEHYQQAPNVLKVALNNLGIDPQVWSLDFNFKSKAFNDKNVTAHHGIIPQEMKFDIAKMTNDELCVYKAIVERYSMQFMGHQVFDVSTSSFGADGHEFSHVVKRIKAVGWSALAGSDGNLVQVPTEDERIAKETDENLWFASAGDYKGKVVDTEIEAKETSPPKPYTDGTLLLDMTRIAKYVSDPKIREVLKQKDADKKGESGSIGTSATRDSIIEKLKERGLIENKGKRLVSTQKGRDFYSVLPSQAREADTTAHWWLLQQDIAENKISANAVQESVVETFTELRDTAFVGKSLSSAERPVIGKCPNCDEALLAGAKSYSCSSNKFEKGEDDKWQRTEGCGFMMFKKVASKTIPAAAVKQLLTEGATDKKVKGFTSKKSNKKFDAYLTLDKATGKINFKFN